MTRHLFVALVAIGAAAVAASAGAADGGPSPGVITGWDGVVGPSGAVRYVALEGGGHTTVAAVLIRSGRVLRYGTVPGNFGIPAVAYDGPVSRELLGEAGVFAPMRIHDLRHTAASLAVQAGANVKAVQRMLGHKSAAMTLDVYADLFDSDLEGVATRLDQAVSGIRADSVRTERLVTALLTVRSADTDAV